jgi:hypothetical protein
LIASCCDAIAHRRPQFLESVTPREDDFPPPPSPAKPAANVDSNLLLLRGKLDKFTNEIIVREASGCTCWSLDSSSSQSRLAALQAEVESCMSLPEATSFAQLASTLRKIADGSLAGPGVVTRRPANRFAELSREQADKVRSLLLTLSHPLALIRALSAHARHSSSPYVG